MMSLHNPSLMVIYEKNSRPVSTPTARKLLKLLDEPVKTPQVNPSVIRRALQLHADLLIAWFTQTEAVVRHSVDIGVFGNDLGPILDVGSSFALGAPDNIKYAHNKRAYFSI